MNARSSRVKLALIIAVSILIVFLIYLGSSALVKSTLNGFDVLTHWKGFQQLFQINQDPYTTSSNASLNQFLGTLGKQDDSPPNRFENPLFALLVYAPLLILKEPESVRIVWMTMNVLFLGMMGYSILRTFKLQKPLWLLVVLGIYLIFGFSSFWPLLTGSSSIVSLLFLVLAVTALSKSRQEVGGVLLAFSLVDLKFAGLTILFLVLWSLFKRNFQFIGWFVATVLFLVGFSMLVLPIWPIHYMVVLFQGLSDGVGAASEGLAVIGNLQLTNRLMWAKNAVLLLVLCFEWLFAKQRGERRILWLVFLTLPISLLIAQTNLAQNAVAALPAIFLSIEVIKERHPGQIGPVAMPILAGIFIVSWLFSGFLFPGIDSFSPELSSMICALFAILILYWVRWWIGKPTMVYEK